VVGEDTMPAANSVHGAPLGLASGARHRVQAMVIACESGFVVPHDPA
jgi:hypothetical protein